MSDHYAEAERLLGAVGNTADADDRRQCLMEAQVHATLAFVQWQRRTDVKHTNLETLRSELDAPDMLRITDLTTGDSHLVPAASRTIPWPPSDELVERVARSMRDQQYRCRDCGGHWMDYVPMARAVLDTLNAGGGTDE